MKHLLLPVAVIAATLSAPGMAQSVIAPQDAIAVATSLLSGQAVDVRLHPQHGATVVTPPQMPRAQHGQQPQLFIDAATGQVMHGYPAAQQPYYYTADDRPRRERDYDDDDDDDERRKKKYRKKKYDRDDDDDDDDRRKKKYRKKKYERDDGERKKPKRKKRRDRDDDDDDDDD